MSSRPDPPPDEPREVRAEDRFDVAAVHRWIVQRLGAPLLELYPEAMAAREEEEEP